MTAEAPSSARLPRQGDRAVVRSAEGMRLPGFWQIETAVPLDGAGKFAWIVSRAGEPGENTRADHDAGAYNAWDAESA